MSNKILYLSCHSVLEADEVKMFSELDYEIFSPGAFVEPANPGDPTMRPGINDVKCNPAIVEQWHQLADRHPGEDGKDYLTREFVDNFDIVVVMHLPRWIIRNWDAMKHKRVIWRTIGQSATHVEQQLLPYRNQGMEIVRYSPREKTIPGYLGENACIRFYKDSEEYKDWSGDNRQVITFAQNMKGRGSHCNYNLFEQVTRGMPRRLFGPGNEDTGDFSVGKVPYEQLKQELRENRCYFYTGTHPASYTLNFIESLMTGIPLVCIGSKWGNAPYIPGCANLYEIPDLVSNYESALLSDNPRELGAYTQELLNNSYLAKSIGEKGRKIAIKHFGKAKIYQQWKEYLG